MSSVQPADTSTGLSTRTAITLAYAGWWVTGLIFWFLERRDLRVRFHAAQALTAFGGFALLIVLLGGLALVSLSFFPALFNPLIVAVELATALALGLWVVSVWQVASGREWRIPLADHWAEKLIR